jgi:hypothetical protein
MPSLRDLEGCRFMIFYNHSIPSGLKIHGEGNEEKKEGIKQDKETINQDKESLNHRVYRYVWKEQRIRMVLVTNDDFKQGNGCFLDKDEVE